MGKGLMILQKMLVLPMVLPMAIGIMTSVSVGISA